MINSDFFLCFLLSFQMSTVSTENTLKRPFFFSSMPNVSQIRYDRSMIVPLQLKQREKPTNVISTTFFTRESTIREEKDFLQPTFLIDEKEKVFRLKLDRTRINLAVSFVVVFVFFVVSHLPIN